MNKAINKPIIGLLKWALVIVTTAVVVITLQVNADNPAATKEVIKNNNVTSANTSTNNNWSPANGFADLIEQVSPAVVHVAISGVVKQRQFQDFNFPPGSPFEDFFEEFRKRQQPPQENKKGSKKKRPLGIGSGFIISPDGYVVTNNHVVQKADEIVVTLTNGDEYQAKLKGTDSKTDLALLKLKKAKNLPYVSWGDDSQSRVGDWVLAIGNPFGLGGSATTGIISARGRDINSGPYDDYIQVDAAINRGNSGGPLFNIKGQVIGINTAIYSPNGGSVGIGFSIPANLAKGVIEQLKEKGEVARAYIGVQLQPMDDELAEGFGLDDDKGALIASVLPGQPADKAGLQAGDVILSYDGKAIEKMRDLPRIVAQSKVGKNTKVEVWRAGSKKQFTIVADDYPSDEELASGDLTNPEQSKLDDFGATLSALTDENRARYRISGDVNGVLVLAVSHEGLAANNNLRAGDVISLINNQAIKSPDDVLEAIKQAQSKDKKKVVMLINRDNYGRFIAFDLSE